MFNQSGKNKWFAKGEESIFTVSFNGMRVRLSKLYSHTKCRGGMAQRRRAAALFAHTAILSTAAMRPFASTHNEAASPRPPPAPRDSPACTRFHGEIRATS
jgi:hypothetical protein